MKFSFGKLLLAFTIIPFVELFLLFKIAELTSALTTLMIIIFTGVVGAFLAKTQGLLVFRKIQKELNSGILPKDQLIEGFCILIGGILLLTPGVITDFVGFTLILPFTRIFYSKYIKKYIKDKILKTTVYSTADYEKEDYTIEIDKDFDDDNNEKR